MDGEVGTSEWHTLLDAVGDFIVRFNLGPWVLTLIVIGIAAWLMHAAIVAYGKRQ